MTQGERKYIRRALREAKAAGFLPFYVFDGEERQKGAKPVMTEAEVLAACDSVDDSVIHFRTQDAQPRRTWARVILGNAPDGSEVIADHSVVPGFDEAMDRAMGF